MQTVSRMLTVRRMFSLLHYRVILARKGPNVKDFFLPFSEYSAPGLGIVHSVQLWCRSAGNWEFAGLFGQWCAVSMRYTALPPAFTRGVVRVAHTGTGGRASPAYPSQKSAKNKNGKHRKITLFTLCFRKFVLPPSLRWRRDPPLTSAGGEASIHPRTLTARQIPIYRATDRYRAVPKGRTITDHVCHDLAVGPADKFQLSTVNCQFTIGGDPF